MRFLLSLPWMREVIDQLEKMTEEQICEPRSEPQFDDEILVAEDLLDVDLRKVYTLAIEKDKASARAIVAANSAIDPERRLQFAKEASHANQEAGMLYTVFLDTLREKHGVAKSADLAVRKGWVVVRKAERRIAIADAATMRQELAIRRQLH